MVTVMELDDMQSRSYLGSYLDVLNGLQRIDECDEMEPLEKSKCSEGQEGQVVSAFSKSLQQQNCNGTKPKFHQKTVKPADSGKAVKVLQELCEAAEAVNSGDPSKEKDGKKSMLNALENIKATLEKIEDIKEHIEEAEEATEPSTVRDFLGVGTFDPSDYTPPWLGEVVGEVVTFMYDVVLSQVSGKQVADFALKATKLALKIGGSFLVFPGNVLVEKLVDLGIQKLSEESTEALEDTIDRIATAAVGRALKIQALREAKIFVDYAEQQIHFHDSLDDGFAHLEGISDGVNSTRKNLSTLFAAETAFNRWLIIENALAAALHRLVPPERPDARTKNDRGGLQPVEERAEFFEVVVDHFLLYLLVLSKMADKVQMEGPEHKLHNSLQKRARKMAKLILPSLAVMFEKQWDNSFVKMFYQPAPEYEHEVIRGLPGPAAKRWWNGDPRWGRRALENFQAFSNQKERQYKTLYKKNAEALAKKLKGIVHNKFLYPQELQQSKWCSSFTDDPESFHHDAMAAEFILKCLFYPLFDAVPVQEIETEHTGPSGLAYVRNSYWNFRHAPKCASVRGQWLSLFVPLAGHVFHSPKSHQVVRKLNVGNYTPQRLWCLEGAFITALNIYTAVPWRVQIVCELVPGLHKIKNTGYTFNSLIPKTDWLTFEVPCASDYAVLEEIEHYGGELFKFTCRYAYFTKAECQKHQ